MIATHDTQKLIYLSLRDIFVGESASLRRLAVVKKLIEKHEGGPQIQYLIQKGYKTDDIATQALSLLQAQIFESPAKAKAGFPELFKDSVNSASASGPSEHKATAPAPVPASKLAPDPAPKPAPVPAPTPKSVPASAPKSVPASAPKSVPASAPKPAEHKATTNGIDPTENVKPKPTDNRIDTGKRFYGFKSLG